MIYVFALVMVLFSIPAILHIRRGLRELRTPDRSQGANLYSRLRILVNAPILLWAIIVFLVVVFAMQK
jgi:hypothetical protein